MRPIKVKDHLGKEYESMSKMCAFYHIGFGTYRARILDGWSVKDALTTPAKSGIDDHTGEKKKMNNGMWATIVAYRGNQDIDVQFEDGSLITNKSYSHFKDGKISTKSLHADNRIGERKKMNCGYYATIIAYNNSHDITIKFDDGTIISQKNYRDFINGLISHPSHRSKMHYPKKYKAYEKIIKENRKLHVGEERYNKNGQKMKIVDYRKYSDIDILFEDGTLITNQRYEKFKDGVIVNPNNKIISHTSINEYTMLYYLSKIGFKKAPIGSLKHIGFGRMELDAYDNLKKVAVEYDGEVHSFRHNSDVRKDVCCYKNNIELFRIREKMDPVSDMSHAFRLDNSKPFSNEYEKTLIDLCKELSVLFGYPSISINFDRDKNIIIEAYEKEYRNSHLGEVYYDSEGRKAEIIRYISANEVIVKFDDGVQKQYHYSTLIRGIFNKYGYGFKNKRLHEKKMMSCGLIAEIIEYNTAANIKIQFEDGVVVDTDYSSFSKASILHPSFTKNDIHLKNQVNMCIEDIER